MEYAIVDIETTGGNAAGSNITEIAIRIHNGASVIQSYETLVHPGKEIPPAIFALTGIDNEMVRDAPRFEEVAATIFQLLEGRVFVAHNVNFDYSFVRHQLEACNFKWKAPKLCTVRMARKIKPGLRSYSLGQLCDALNIPIQNRHRAGGDCDATVLLFSKLLEWDANNVVGDMLKKSSKDQRLPPNLPQEQFETLPEKPGIYYFHDQKGKVIYIGKAINIKKRVSQHFTGHTIQPQRQHFLREIFSISSEICATELMALLLECIEIKKLWPAYNRALKKFEPKYGLFVYEDLEGYLRLAVGKSAVHYACVAMVNKEYEATMILKQMVDTFGIDTRFCRFTSRPSSRMADSENQLLSQPRPDPESHNMLVQQAVAYLEMSRPTFVVLDKGRTPGEHSCIWMEKGHFYGMGYINDANQLSGLSDVREQLQRASGNHYMSQLILSYAAKYPSKIIPLDSPDGLSVT